MKLITRHTDYAVSALCAIALKKNPATASVLSAELKMPYAFLRGILQKLQKNNILTSHRGKSGGFLLSRPADQITLACIIDIFQDSLKANGCVFKKLPCPRQRVCSLRRKLNRVETVLKRELESVTIASLLQPPAKGRAN